MRLSEPVPPGLVPEPVSDDVSAAMRVVVIGASTGGPQALRDLLGQLPAEFAPPCVVVQHLPASFAAAFTAQLVGRP